MPDHAQSVQPRVHQTRAAWPLAAPIGALIVALTPTPAPAQRVERMVTAVGQEEDDLASGWRSGVEARQLFCEMNVGEISAGSVTLQIHSVTPSEILAHIRGLSGWANANDLTESVESGSSWRLFDSADPLTSPGQAVVWDSAERLAGHAIPPFFRVMADKEGGGSWTGTIDCAWW